jgi:hypothetical protein
MQDVVEKLTRGRPLNVDRLLDDQPALKEAARARLDNRATGAAVLRRCRKGGIVRAGRVEGDAQRVLCKRPGSPRDRAKAQ